MTIYRLRLNQIWFDHIVSGTKIYEGRVAKGSTANYKIGDVLIFIRRHTLEEYKCIITEILHFNTYKDALETLPLSQVLPSVETIDEGCNVYLQWDSLSDQLKYGIKMIKFKEKEESKP